MKLLQALPVIALLASGSNACAQTILVDFYNNMATDICIEEDSGKDCRTVAPRQSGKVTMRNSQWITLGQKAYRYNIPRIHLKPGLRLQAEPNGKLYLLPPDAPFPASAMPKQPVSFPLEPTRIVHLK